MVEQDLTKDYPDCCAKLVRVERKFKRIDLIDASSVKISKFKGRFGGKKVESSTLNDIDSEVSSTSTPSVTLNKKVEEGEATEQPTE